MTESLEKTAAEKLRRGEALREIINGLIVTRAAGETVTDESIIEQNPDLMPELADELRNLRLVECAEQDAQSIKEGLRIRCPHCHNPVELADDSSLSEVLCPSCGSQFSLVDDADQTFQARSQQTIGHFQLLDKVGIGAFGSVWSARDTELDRQVAVKIPRKGQLSVEDGELFIREARAAAQLKHANIVSVLEVGRHEDRIYIVTEFVQGLDLADWLTDQQATPREAAELCATIADALQHAHDQGVIHRDLKPSNIMLDTAGEPHLMDFGLAKRESGEMTMTVEGKLLGTPAYMSPEQARGAAHDADARSDVYSLGVILFELLTGERPFRGSTRMLLHQVLAEDAPSPRKLSSQVPKDLETICLKCLEKAPDGRYQTAAELREELRRFLRGEPVESRPIAKFTRAWRWCQRKPVVAGLGAAVACLLLILGIAGPIIAVSQASLAQNAQDERDSAQRESERALAAEELANHRLQETEVARQLAVKTAESLRQSGYASDIRAAQVALEHSNRAQASHLLRKYSPQPGGEDLRGLEWRYLWNRLKGNALQTWRTDHYVNGIQWSPTGEYVMTGSANEGITEIRSARDGQLVHRWRHSAMFTDTGNLCPSFSPDGKYVAMASTGRVVLASPRTGETVREIPLPKENTSFFKTIFSADGNLLAVNALRSIHIIDLESDSITATINTTTRFAGDISFTPQGDGLIAAEMTDRSPALAWYDLATRKPTKRFPLPEGAWPRVWAVARQHRLLACAAGSPAGQVFLWNLDDKQPQPVWHAKKVHTSVIDDITFSADETRIATSGWDQTIQVLDVRDGHIQTTLRGHENEVWGVAAAPDGSGLASASKDGTIKLWSWESAQQGLTRNIPGLAISYADHRRLATWSPSGEIRFWDEHGVSEPLKPKIPDNHDRAVVIAEGQSGLGKATHLQIAKSGRIFLTEAGELNVFDPEKDKLTSIINNTEASSQKFVVAPDERHVAVIRALYDHEGPRGFTMYTTPCEVRLINVQSREVLLKTAGVSGLSYMERSQVAFSSDGELLAFPTNEHTILIWDIDKGRPVHELDAPKWHLNCLRFAPSDRLLAAGGWEGTVWLWDVNSGHLAVPPMRGTGSGITSVHFTRDEQTLLTSAHDTTVRAWSTASGQEMLELRGRFLVGSQAILAKDSLLVFDAKDGLSVEYIPTLDEIQAEHVDSMPLPGAN